MPSITFPTAVAAVGAAGSIASGVMGAGAAKDAANAQAQGAADAAQVQREGLKQQQAQFDTTRGDALNVYNTSRNDLSPYRNIGTNALLALSDTLGIARPAGFETTNTGNPRFQTDPGYEFAKAEGMKAVDARFPGMSRSGAKMKALNTYGQGVADQQYGNWLDRLGKVASVGQTATGQSASLGTNLTNTLADVGNANSNAIGNYSVNAGNLAQNAAAARASGYVGSANAWSGAANNLAGIAGNYSGGGSSGGGSNWLSQLFGGSSYKGDGNGEW